MSTWNDFVTAALIGSEKTAPPPLPSSIEATLAAAAEMDREIRFLTQAGALALYRRAGRKLSGNQTAIALAEPETTRRINAASTTFLRAMLGGRHLVLLPEWLGEAVRLSLHVPPQLLPALLDRARQDRALRPLVIGAGGRRAQWLAAHHPTWSFSVAESSECWETGSRDQRVALLRALRMSNPAEARSRVEAVWKTESADTRTAFITELLEGLSGDDLPFLEAALDDRSKEVRRVAIDLLARVPSAPFVTRMLERATPLLVYKPGKGAAPGSFEVLLPADPDAAGTRDGLDPKAFGAQKVLGEKAVLLVLILSAVPLRHWSDTFQKPPATLVKALGKNEFASAVMTGWVWAARRQGDADWVEALYDSKIEAHGQLLPGESLFTLLPEAARVERLIAMLEDKSLKKANHSEWYAFNSKLNSFLAPWPATLAREVLTRFRLAAKEGIGWHLHSLSQSLLLGLPPALLDDATRGWALDQYGVSEFVEAIAFRRDALLALSQS